MDVPISLHEWQLTDITIRQACTEHTSEKRAANIDNDSICDVFETLAIQTKQLMKSPYDPALWLDRAQTLHYLHFPELAVGDAWKSIQLCEHILCYLNSDKIAKNSSGQWKLGFARGFWMFEAADDHKSMPASQSEFFAGELETVDQKARQIVQTNLVADCSMVDSKGRFLPCLYPWTPAHQRQRGNDLLSLLNSEAAVKSHGMCEVRPHAFGNVTGETDQNNSHDIFGVFAKQKIQEGQEIMSEKTLLWGYSVPETRGSNQSQYCEPACPTTSRLQHESEKVVDRGRQDGDRDLGWIRDRRCIDAASVILLVKTLLLCCTQSVQARVESPTQKVRSGHPLDCYHVARLTPSYRNDVSGCRVFSIVEDIEIPNIALQRHGKVDIFADHRYDTWVLFTISARLDNNVVSDPLSEALFPMFSLLNHDCDANALWEGRIAKDGDREGARHSTVVVTSSRKIDKGEQLCVMYDPYLIGVGVEHRRKRLSRWIGGSCACAKCTREIREANSGKIENGMLTKSVWDLGEYPVLPEDRFS